MQTKKKVVEYEDIGKWGLEDFQTRIELGNYIIRHPETDARLGNARTLKEARKLSADIRNTLEQETGRAIPRLIVEAEMARINPTKRREDVLSGQADIFEALPRYIHAMEKRIVFNPMLKRYKRDVRQQPNVFTPDVQNILQQQINAATGANYTWLDHIGDEFATVFGFEHGLTNRVVTRGRKFEAITKLGYRPISALINRMTGMGMTYVKTGLNFYVKASNTLRNGVYTDSTGATINLENRLLQLENNGQLGVDFAVEADGTVATRVPIWHPLRLFQSQELPLRRHSYTANYIMQRERYGLTDQQAHWNALQGLRFQQATYNTAAIPEMLRSPLGRTVGQFRSFMINQMQFWASLNTAEFVRMLQVQLMLAGPRGFVYFLRSVPILGALGLLDELERELVSGEGVIPTLSRGVFGLVGGDVSAPATFQFPNTMEEWLGPLLSDVFKLFRDVIVPGAQAIAKTSIGSEKDAPAFVTDNAIDWALGLSPYMFYLRDVAQSTMYWDAQRDFKQRGLGDSMHTLLNNVMQPNVWIRDANGNKAYQIGGLWDRTLLAAGIAPLERTKQQAMQRIWRDNMMIRRENRTKWLGKVIKNMQRGHDVTELLEDAALYDIDPRSIPDRLKWAEMTPEQRALLRARLLDRAEALDHFGF